MNAARDRPLSLFGGMTDGCRFSWVGPNPLGSAFAALVYSLTLEEK
jgi:hypothetical protein